MTEENKQFVTNYLKEIKKNLPEWVKSNDQKVEDILLEISSHIWENASEIANSDDPDQSSLQEAMKRLGYRSFSLDNLGQSSAVATHCGCRCAVYRALTVIGAENVFVFVEVSRQMIQ
jgi:KaiC/GvpD/RAD55 family RecA-like ATPase